MKLSVIIPCYNAEKYLSACLDSVLVQSMADFEALLIDDGSQDRTYDIASVYARGDERVRVIRQENAGVSAARNAGLAVAKGEWVTFVDADDLLLPDAFETLLSAADEGVDMVAGTHETFDEETGQAQTVYSQTLWMMMPGERRRHAAALRLIEGDAVLNIMCNKLHRRSFLVREGIRLTPGVAIAEDALFNLEAVLCAREIAYVERTTYRYRIHALSATHQRTKLEFAAHLPWLIAMGAMLKRRHALEQYYPAYFATVVLRLYKDGGVSGVMRQFAAQARPLLEPLELDEKRLSLWGKALRMLCKTNLYPKVYPLIYPFELAARKMSEAAFVLRTMRRG